MDEINNDEELKTAKKSVTHLISYEVYGESTPQAILQAYTLWKRPTVCFGLNYYNGKLVYSKQHSFKLNLTDVHRSYVSCYCLIKIRLVS